MVKTNEKIIKVATELFSRLDYDAVSFTEIAQRARVQKSAIWYHFSSKKQLYSAVIKEVFTTMNFGQSTLSSHDGYREGMVNFVKAFSSTWLQNPQLALLTSRAILNHRDKSRAIARKFWQPFVDGVEKFISEGQKAREFNRLLSPKLFAMQLGGAVVGVTYSLEFHRYLAGSKRSREQLLAEFQGQLLQTVERTLFL